MLQLTLIFAVAAGLLAIERIRPGRSMPSPAGWYARAALLNSAQLATVVLAGLTWNLWFSSVTLLELSGRVPPSLEGLAGWFVGTFVFYWWHRLRHESNVLWRFVHQVHHSPARIEVLTSFYKHPLEIVINSIIASILMYGILGASLEGAAWFNVFAAAGEMFYHANIRTPRWTGWFLQRPEHHSIHHETGVHAFNYGDITWWDRLFGTFRDTDNFAARCGFEDGRERLLARMLVFRRG